MAKLKCVTTKNSDGFYPGQYEVLKALGKIAKDNTDRNANMVWLYELEDALKSAGYEFGSHYMEGGEGNRLRRIKSTVTKAKKMLKLNLMAKGMAEENAIASIDAKPGLSWRIEQVPQLGFDVDDFMDSL